jgi:asparagine synthase (glutamine-hydrolysing)
MSILLSTENFPNSKKIGQIFVKTTGKSRFLLEDDGNYYYIKGNVYEPINPSRMVSELIKNGNETSKSFEGEFTIIRYDQSADTIWIGNDILGRETLYYYVAPGKFIVSDNFWEIVNIINPRFDDIDEQTVFESVLLQLPFDDKTIIKGLYFFPPATVGKYTLADDSFSYNSYWDFRYTPDSRLDIHDAIEKVDITANRFFSNIQNIYPPSTRFLLGLSGGLDSRLILAYGLRYGLDIKGFIIGTKRPNKLFLSRDHASAYSLAKHFGIRLYNIRYDRTSYAEKMYLEVKHFPQHQARLFHTQAIKYLPEYDVMLNGLMGGETFGSELWEGITSLEKLSFLESLSQRPMWKGALVYSLKRRLIERAYNKFIKETDFSRFESKGYIQTEEREDLIREKFKHFIETETAKGKTNVDILQALLFKNLSNSKYGSFCMYPEKPNYSMFSSIFKVSLSWPPEFLINKKVQVALLKIKFPALSKIPAQDNLEPIYYRENPGWRKMYYNAIYSLRGTGCLSYRTKAYKKNYMEFAYQLLKVNNPIMEKLFNTDKMIFLGVAPHENLLKVKYLLDVILDKKYNSMID